jgi:glycosyltransferase involved in cell wall biosynthesis
MNYAIEISSFNYVAKFDDDDYYAPSYLLRQMAAFTYTNADIVGKCTRYIFFSGRKILVIDNPGQENKYVKFICGPTMVINKRVFEQVKFQNITLGEDTQFLKDCLQAGFKIYATDRFDFVYLRNSKQGSHTWEIDEDRYLRSCLVIGHTNDYITPVTR